MIDLTEALKKLAEKEPEKFEIKGDDFYWNGGHSLGAVDLLNGELYPR